MAERWKLDGSKALVTGGSRGIGAAIAEELLALGAEVMVVSRKAEDITAQVARWRTQGWLARGVAADVTTATGRAAIVAAVERELGALHCLVNNAGTGHADRVRDLTYETWRQVLATDLDGPFLCAQRAAEIMRLGGRGGRIVNITSVHEHVPRLGAAAYCTAKAGLGMLTKVLALELAEDGILVNSVAPGEIATPMTGQGEEGAYRTERPGNPVGRPGHVHEVASVVAFLASRRSSYLTGASITVDGGLSLMAAHGHDDAASGWREV